MKKILALVLCAAMMISMIAVAGADDTVTLRMATGYNSAKTGITFDSETAGEGVTLADGVTYTAGSLKPTWVALEEILGVKFESKYQGNSAAKEFEYWKDRLAEVDMVAGSAATLNEYGETGSLVNLAEYMDKLPNFKAYLDANPIVRLSIMGNTTTGAIYFSPYFDGVNDIERMPLMRADYAAKLLDGEGEFTADACKDTAAPVYTPYMPTAGTVAIETPTADGTATQVLTKNYDKAGNIIAKMNEKGAMSGVEAVNMLRTYIDEAYDGYYGTTRSNLFIGQDAAWDVDELVELLRCVVANPQTLNGTDTIQGMFSREENNNQRRVDLFRFAGHLFGVRGMESRQDYLYFGTDGALKDARQDVAAYEALAKMHDMVTEGLISKAFVDGAEENSSTYLENDNGFVSYDYNQTQTVMNATKLQEGEKYMAIMVPVAKWFDGTEGGVFMRLTQTWRYVKTDAWAKTKAGLESNPPAQDKALAQIDKAYSEEGPILMSYGPKAFIKEGETFLINGKEMPVIADATYAELWDKAKGNYTNYARQFLGSTLSFVKSQAFEYQCTHEVGREGAGHISAAIGLGTIKHPLLEVAENPWYTSIPTVLPNTKTETDMLNTYTELTSNGKFASNKGGENLFVDIIVNGLSKTAEEQAAEVTGDWHGKQYLALREAAWKKLVAYYSALN
jgi:putative aldouronate transport system substrate-binding protein